MIVWIGAVDNVLVPLAACARVRGYWEHCHLAPLLTLRARRALDGEDTDCSTADFRQERVHEDTWGPNLTVFQLKLLLLRRRVVAYPIRAHYHVRLQRH